MTAAQASSIGDLQDQRALVTGATSGIGRAIALHWPAREPRSSSTAVTPPEAPRQSRRSPPPGDRARFVAADLADPADLQRLVDDVGGTRRAGEQRRVLLVWPDRGPRRGHVRRLVHSDVRAPYFLVAASRPKMAAKGRAASSASAAWPARSARGRRRLWGDEGGFVVDDAGAGRGVQPQRCASERRRRGPGVHASPRP